MRLALESLISLHYCSCYRSARAAHIWAKLARPHGQGLRCVCANSGERERDQLRPIIHQTDSWVTAFTSPGTYPVSQEEGRGGEDMRNECFFQEKRGRRNKQTKQVVGFTYQVPLFFPSFRASLEALWKHKEENKSSEFAWKRGWAETSEHWLLFDG